MKNTLFLSLILVLSSSTFSQNNYRSPLDIPLVLSANFGELRPNHFHTGVDLKTQAVINKNVYSIEEGYVARIGVNAAGYGLVLYINHPNGQTSVYAHLNSFSSKIAEYVKAEQYRQERYAIDIRNIAPADLPLNRGEMIAKSGNTGSSGGPHVHFELRDTQSENAIDPLPYYLNNIADNVAPEIRGIAIYPIEGKGVVNNSANPFRENITRKKNGAYNTLNKQIEAWGKIGIGIHSVDRMNETNNIYGVKLVRLYCEDEKIFSTDINYIDFSTTRMINSFVDYDFWRYNKKFFMKSFIEPGNSLHIYDDSKKGYITIDEERTYSLRYELEDMHGNTTTYKFAIEGKQREIPTQEPCSLVMHWDKDNRYISDHFHLTIPKEYLYRNENFVLTRQYSDKYYSEVYKVHHSAVPLDNYVDMSLELQSDPLPNKKQYGVVAIDERGRESWVGGEYSEGYVTAKIRELGQTYAIFSDTLAPEINAVTPEKWAINKKIVIRLSDNMSGVRSFRGTVDGEFVLFEHDVKSPNYTYSFDESRLNKGGVHELEFTATDAVGNVTGYRYEFKY